MDAREQHFGVFFDTRKDHAEPKFDARVKEPMNSTMHLLVLTI